MDDFANYLDVMMDTVPTSYKRSHTSAADPMVQSRLLLNPADDIMMKESPAKKRGSQNIAPATMAPKWGISSTPKMKVQLSNRFGVKSKND